MYSLERIYPIGEHPEIRSRGVMRIPAVYLIILSVPNYFKNSDMSPSLLPICENFCISGFKFNNITYISTQQIFTHILYYDKNIFCSVVALSA